MEIKSTPLKDCFVIHNDLHGDDRGYFMEAFNRTRFKKFDLDFSVEQINIAQSKKNVFRGLHFQLDPFAQTKIVLVLFTFIFFGANISISNIKTSSYSSHFSSNI